MDVPDAKRSDLNMDSASASDIREFLSNSATRLDRQKEQMVATGRVVQALVTQRITGTDAWKTQGLIRTVYAVAFSSFTS